MSRTSDPAEEIKQYAAMGKATMMKIERKKKS
eukprot:CAMPEP_0170490030 /NCGR_PEP_ID=MMETSP0208-20121228/8310_1 /TAXON_ID=197538 /ORGANISM="Strombidium inclinatum, Strain S3" /LENGTH=31 /DNA_ID= /DNA_START= /DNA_END= /DNA_ORIENTATION=